MTWYPRIRNEMLLWRGTDANLDNYGNYEANVFFFLSIKNFFEENSPRLRESFL